MPARIRTKSVQLQFHFASVKHRLHLTMASFDKGRFWRRVSDLYRAWKSKKAMWNEATAFMIICGKNDENIIYQRSLSLQLWTCGYELFDTLIVFMPDEIHVMSSSKKTKLFEAIGVGEGPKIVTHEKVKGDNYKEFREVIDTIMQGKDSIKLGWIPKDKQKGEFASSFLELVQKSEVIELVDISLAIDDVLSVKAEDEIDACKKAAIASSVVLKHHLIPKIATIIEEELKCTHSRLAEECEEVITSPGEMQKLLSKARIDGVSADEIDSSYTPVIMSGQEYNLKPSASSNDDNLDYGVIIVALGGRYKSYCSNIARTLFINASNEQKKTYSILLKAFSACKSALVAGNAVSDAWTAAIRVIRAKDPSLESKFTKNCGFGTGIGFRDSSLIINGQNQGLVKTGMIFNICVGFQNLQQREHGNSTKYAMMVADTVLIADTASETLTDFDPSFGEVSYELDLGDEVEDDDAITDLPMSFANEAGPKTRGARHAKENDEAAIALEEKRKADQKALAQRKKEESIRKFASNAVDRDFSEQESDSSIIESYKNAGHLPADAPLNQIFVDVPRRSLVVPINGQLVPFHVDVIKSVNASQQGDDTILRVNFLTPDTSLKNRVLPSYADKSLIYIRELSFRSNDAHNLNRAMRLILELRKRIKQREDAQAVENVMIAQEDLRLRQDRKQCPRLRAAQIRPKVQGGKTMVMIEGHLNGFLVTSNKGTAIEIIYSNIKHAVFQPCKGTISVIIHFELKNPVKCGKKTTSYIQIYADVIEASQDLGSRRDTEDGLREEQDERKRRRKFNEKFKQFVDAVEEDVSQNDPGNAFEFDIPYRELSFEGVPGKSSLTILPTLHCLVALEDNPPFVLTLGDIEVAHFERVQLSLKSFDLVFVHKDFDKPVIKIGSIPTKFLSTIQSYLNESEILYYVGPVNLQWNNLLKKIKEDLQGFYEMGSWEAMLGDSEEQEGNEEEALSEFELEGSVEEDSEEYASEDDYEDEEEAADNYDEDDMEIDEEAPSWEELENRARVSDRKRNFDDEEEEGARRKKSKKK